MYDRSTTATPTTARPEGFDVGMVAVDLYKDIHKGIRAELFDLTAETGSVDPADRIGRAAVADHVRRTVALLVSHAHHEDTLIQPAIEEHLPNLAELIEADHVALEERMDVLVEIADASVPLEGAAQRPHLHQLYLELASFTASYLRHQDVEERVVMPALESKLGVEAVLGIHLAIVGSIPPDEMASSLALMLPAMNIDDRCELLGGMQAGAPPEVFAGVWNLATSVLAPADAAALGRRLGLG